MGGALADERVAAPERRRRYDELFDLIDSVLADAAGLPATQAAQSAAETLGLPWEYTASIGHLNVCLDAQRSARYGVRIWGRLVTLRWPRRSFTSLGKTYVTVTDRYGNMDGPFNRMRPATHEYSGY